MVGSPEAIRALVEPPLVSSGVELWDVEVSPDTVRVLVDRPGGVDLDALAAVAGRVVSPLLDEHPEVTPDGRFSLEVSSPGVERDLRRVEHYARYVGAEISVKTAVAIEGSRRHQGVLVSADGEGIVVAPAGGEAGGVALRYADIDRARTVLVWGPKEKPGAGKKAAGKKGAGPGAVKAPRDTQAVKRPAAAGREPAVKPVASNEPKDPE
jgi:ribosome maturation factor RimP